jgi:heme exporter protein A
LDGNGTSNDWKYEPLSGVTVFMNRLALEEVACWRGGRLLFEGLSLALGPGEAAIATGPNGIGKSSLLRMAAGLLAPAGGRVVHEGAIALAAEASALDTRLPLAEALLFWARIDGRKAVDVTRGLDAMGLKQLSDVPVRLLSTGQRRRATLARVVAADAPIWLLDEPGNGLDAESLDRLAGAMATHRAGGGIILAASHQPLGLDDARVVAL